MKVRNDTKKELFIHVGKIGGIPQINVIKPGVVLDLKDLSPQERYYSAAVKNGMTPIEDAEQKVDVVPVPTVSEDPKSVKPKKKWK